ncbi:hypothetical protein ACFRCI_19785 [Streptomyces sp. NPDC056638]|uniref:hypothetical protein n=1 Tax=Streptomyces sp. NPDC056638 TaxID=3345887 RepID=UPI00369840E0
MGDQTTPDTNDFDPDAFPVVPVRTFEELRVAEVFRAPSRTLTDAHPAVLQTVSTDNQQRSARPRHRGIPLSTHR